MVLSPGTRADHQHEGSRSRQEEAPSGHDSRVAVPQAFMTSLLGMWTQSDSTLRRGAIEDLFRPDAHFHDKDGAYVGSVSYTHLSSWNIVFTRCAGERSCRIVTVRVAKLVSPHLLGESKESRATW